MISVNGDLMEWDKGLTVRDIINYKRYVFPLLGVWINDVPVSRDDFNDTTVPDEAKVQVIHMISGG